jgi:hypothetical protein
MYENYVYIIVFIVGFYNLFMSLFPESDPYESGTESLCYDSGIKGYIESSTEREVLCYT